MMKKFLLLAVFALFSLHSTYAASVAFFVVEVTPSTFGINQPVDLTVKAVDGNGSVVKDYTNTIFIEVQDIKDLQDVTLPSDGIYTFSAQDQGVKTFSKGLSFKTAGTYTVTASDIQNDALKGQAKVTVSSSSPNPGTTTTTNSITFSSPLPNATETNSVVSVIGNTSVKNAKVQILIDGNKVAEEQATANGDFTSFLTDVAAGPHTLQAQIYDINNTVVAQSDTTSFSYQPAQGGSILQFDVLPSKTLKQGQKATFAVKTAADISSVELTLTSTAGDKAKVILDKIADGEFQKQLLMDTVGVYTIDAQYVNSKETKTSAGISTLTVLEGKGIKEVTYVIDPIDKTKIQLSWKLIGSFDYVLAKYGTNKDDLTSSVILSGGTGIIQGVNVASGAYYVRVFPADMSGNIIGEPSDIILVEQVQGSAPVCRVNGITVYTKKIGDQYFLTWKAVENAERYIVYRSDKLVSSVADMQKVGETSDVKFPYPFDPQAKTDGYAYYAVVAMCQDGTSAQLGNAKKVKVGPETSILIAFLVSLMIFGIYRMRKIA